ncbi:MAG: HlyD family efflux transporter periplasmic adaptor subunit [Clostridia bacterium]|nr:HlyD family efflux transporter periplasmic adaptor subunit [Clostridia bacterium]
MKKGRKKSPLRRIIWILLILAVIGAVGYFVIFKQINAAVTVTYDTYTVKRGDISNSLSFSGSMSAKNYETLSADKSGTVRKIYVTEAEPVVKDQRLIRLSTGEIIKASFDGQVNEISVEEGDEVTANQNLIQIVDFSQMTVSLRVDEYSISKIHVGQACRISLTALGTTLNSEIAHINRISSSNGNTAYYTVSCEATVSDDVLPGMQVTVTIPLEEASDAIILSKSAVSFAGDNSAFVLVQDSNGEMQRVAVQIGVDNDNYVEITDGLTEGQTVYKVAETKSNANSGLLSGLSSLMNNGQNQNNSNQTRNSQRNYSGQNNGFPNGGNFGGSNRPGGMP